MDSHAIIYCFTGTGNAACLARSAAGDLDRRGVRATVSPIEDLRVDPAHGDAALIGLISPVLGFGLPRNVAAFLRRLPPGRGQRTFVIISMGNTETITLGSHRWEVPPTEGIAIRQALDLLKRRGYDVIRAEAFEMPTNWILATNPPTPDRAAVLTARNIERVAAFMDKLARGEQYHQPVRPLYAIAFGLVYSLFALIGRRYSGKWFFADDACNGCKQCFSQCPQGTIRWRNNRPVWRWNCLQCFRCINLCPQGAIQVSGLAIVATFAPLLFMGFCYRHSLGILLSHRGSGIGHVVCYLIVSIIIVSILHRLQCSPMTGRFIPRWPLTKNRTRYREPEFTPPERSRSA